MVEYKKSPRSRSSHSDISNRSSSSGELPLPARPLHELLKSDSSNRSNSSRGRSSRGKSNRSRSSGSSKGSNRSEDRNYRRSVNSSSSGELPLPAEDIDFSSDSSAKDIDLTSDSSGELPLPAIDGWGFSDDGDGSKPIDEPSGKGEPDG